MSKQATVYIVDDDEAVRDSLGLLLKSVGIPNKTFENASAFLDAGVDPHAGCLVLDIRMPGLSGLELQQKLKETGNTLPIIFITGHGDVPMAVEAMKHGAVEFIQKPFREQDLLDCINRALTDNFAQQSGQAEIQKIREHLATLTPREREVMQMVIDGKANKVIAYDLGLSQRTVEIHRAHVMEKMGVRSLAELVRMVIAASE
jgi:FixJ family two-component response regulator